MSQPADANVQDGKRSRLSQLDVPSMDLERTLKLARAIWDNFAGRSARPIQIASALEVKPSSGGWREITGASIAYGLTEGGSKSQEIILTDLGRRIVAPREEGEESVAIREAALAPRVCREFFHKYDGAKFPIDRIADSILIDMGVPKDRTDRVLGILKANATFASLIQEIKGEKYVALNVPANSPAPKQDDTYDDSSDDDHAEPQDDGNIDRGKVVELPSREPAAPKKIFVAHGRKHEALDAIKQVLERFKVPFVVAVDEAHAGRPISEKVAHLMKECTAGLFIFTPDEMFVDGDGKQIFRPSENVVFELGAGSVLWGRKIVILKEKGVTFASDYRDIGYIEFSMDSVKSIGSELLMELIALDFVKLQVG